VTHDGYNQLAAVAPECAGRFSADTPAHFGTEGIDATFVGGGFDTGPYAMPAYQDVIFPSRDLREPPIEIRVWWVPVAAPDAPAVILVRGRNSCRHDTAVLLPAGMLAPNGYSVLLMDVRDQGDSSIEDGRSGWGSEEYLDILGAWDWLPAAQGLRADRIGLVGESLRASSAIIAMGEEPAVAAT
jgi:dipeptidyl aminopeptidase/acylaminoacyl peptidase